MEKILILGGGYGALRYLESLIWDTEKEITICGFEIQGKSKVLSLEMGLPWLAFDKLNINIINDFSCIIVALPPEVKRRCIEKLTEMRYINALILEKPLCIQEEDLLWYMQELPRMERCAVVCQRDYEEYMYYWKDTGSVEILYPSFNMDDKFNKWHMLPHILSLLYTIGGEIPNIKKIKKNYYKGLWCESDISIQFVSHDVKECLTICGKSFPAVKYREKNILIVDRVMCYSQYETQRNLEKAFAVTQAIIYLNEEDNN